MSHPAGCQCGDDDAHVILQGTQDFLYGQVDREQVVALNAAREGAVVIKPWDRRGENEPVSASRMLEKPRLLSYQPAFGGWE